MSGWSSLFSVFFFFFFFSFLSLSSFLFPLLFPLLLISFSCSFSDSLVGADGQVKGEADHVALIVVAQVCIQKNC